MSKLQWDRADQACSSFALEFDLREPNIIMPSSRADVDVK